MATGLDPEFLLIDPEGFIVPASKVFEKSADEPYKKAPVVYDNAAVEVRPHSAGCLQGLNGNLNGMMRRAMKKFRLARMQKKIPRGTEPSLIPAAPLRDEDRELEEVAVFGCSPAVRVEADMSITEEVTPNVDAQDTEFRSAGYHVHESVSGGGQLPMHRLTQRGALSAAFLDAMIGLVDVMMLERAGMAEAGRIRRQTLGYGRAGEFRVRKTPKKNKNSYQAGIFEYRVMSPWPLSARVWTWWVHSAVRQGCFSGLPGKMLDKLPDRSEIVQAINDCDAAEAERLWKAALRAWIKEIRADNIKARPGNDSLAPDNIRRLIFALNRDGFETFTGGNSLYREWVTGHPVRPTRFEERLIARQKDLEMYANKPKSEWPYWVRRRVGYTRPRQSYWYFPSGTERYITDQYGKSSWRGVKGLNLEQYYEAA